MNKFLTEKKWLVLSALAIVVVAALVIGIVAVTGCGEKDPHPTEGTSNVGVTDPTGTTGGNGDNAAPTDPEVPGVTDPTGTPENPAKPDNPERPDDHVEPTEPDVTIPEPTTPDIDPDDVPNVDPEIKGDGDENDEDLVTPPVTPPTPDVDVDDEMFGGVTGATIRYSDWESWDHKTRQAFLNAYAYCDDPEIIHNILKATTFKDYDCGFEGHACKGENAHNALMERIAEGCRYCGKNDCPSFFALSSTLFTEYDPYACPEYDEHLDPTVYCQTCGLKKGEGKGECNKSLSGRPCEYCGAEREPNGCHTCDGED